MLELTFKILTVVAEYYVSKYKQLFVPFHWDRWGQFFWYKLYKQKQLSEIKYLYTSILDT